MGEEEIVVVHSQPGLNLYNHTYLEDGAVWAKSEIETPSARESYPVLESSKLFCELLEDVLRAKERDKGRDIKRI